MAKTDGMLEESGRPEGVGADEGGAHERDELHESACPGESKAAPCQSPDSLAALPDAHCHVAFMESPGRFAADAASAGANVLSVTVTPEEYEAMESRRPCSCELQPSTIRTALGLHPWWVPESEQKLAEMLANFDGLAPNARFIGEVGLDFSKRRVHTRSQQLQAFQHIMSAASEYGAQALSLHCVNAYPEALSILESSGCTEQCVCIFHWFSGSSDQLARAKRLGCWFSAGERMLQTKRGREYAKAIPLERLFLETDAPAATDPELHHPAVPYSFTEHQAELRRTLSQLAELRRTSPESLADAIQENTHRVLN